MVPDSEILVVPPDCTIATPGASLSVIFAVTSGAVTAA